MPEERVDAEEALRAACRAGRRLSGLQQDPDGALEILEPYSACPEYSCGEWVGPEQRDLLLRVARAMVCAVTGDCHRGLGDVRTAAEWYRRAGQCHKACGFAAIYADMVLQHWLDDHYEVALDYLRQSLADWQSRPLLVRFYWHVVSGWWRQPWNYRESWRTVFRQRALLAQLEARVAERE